MMKVKGVASVAVPMEFSPYVMYEEQRNRFKHQSLLQDFAELQKETETSRKKLHMMKERKLTLLAEVRFLKRRYHFLMENKSSNPLMERNLVQQKNLGIRSKSIVKGKSNGRKQPATKRMVPILDSNQKGKTYHEKEATLQYPPPLFDLNQMQQKTNSVKEVPLQSTVPVLDLNKKERVYSGKEAKEAIAQTMTPVFDLNQISMEEEELQANDDPLRVEELKKSSIRSGSDEQHNDMKLSVCRSTGNVPNRVGKRKITWQDQVALRV
ncbi:hypothetical protein SLEP1_g15620 [Rubroshorea leprosula]|uniref:Uncharacterized protein n=1 Tax=Rubroshorea leprosula TaxID=152421 RepID=A0AAV5IXD6_9ROSI|nr:hypothetical protein SLEP1_g15620 [Rubroshorea leprosula]